MQRYCKVLECGREAHAVALYVFYRVDATAMIAGRVRARQPGKGWRNAIDLRPGDLLQLVDGSVAVVDKLVAAPRIDDVCGLPVERMRTYAVGDDGTWACNRTAETAS